MTRIAAGAGARLLESGAELAVEVHAATLPQLFDMAALSAMSLQYLPLPLAGASLEHAQVRTALEALGGEQPARELALTGHDRATLLVHWLSELEYLVQTEQFVYTGAAFRELGPSLAAAVSGVRPAAAPLRELKGISYHQLVVNPVGDDWLARVSFDL